VYRNSLSRVAAGAAVAAGLGVGLAACGGHSNNSGSGSGGSSSAVVTQAGQGARLSGTYTALDFWGWVPNGLYPSSISEIPGSNYNTNGVVKVNAKYDASSESCSSALETMGGPGYGEEAYVVDQGEDSGKTKFWAYAIYEFPSADQASSMVKDMAAKAASCANFSISNNGTSFAATLALGPVSEAEVPAADVAVDIRESITVANGQKAVGDILLSADGNVVVVESASGTATVPTEVNLTQVAQEELAAIATGEATAAADHAPSDTTSALRLPARSGKVGGVS
jgi:hypothetical protein